MQFYTKKTNRGVSIVEAAASLALLFPLVMLIVFVVLEASYAYLIRTSLSQAAQQAARELSVVYGQDPTISTDRSQQDSQVFNTIRITNIINNSQQFDNPLFDTTGNPPTVSVTVRYLSNQYGLPAFPSPDPLQLGNKYQITATSTYRLE